MGRITGLLFVNFVLCLICFIAYSSQIFIIWPWYGSELSIELLTLLAPFKFVIRFPPLRRVLKTDVDSSLLVWMLLWNYYLCVNTDPGTVPDFWVRILRSFCLSQKHLCFVVKRPDTRSEGYEVKKLTGAPRYCRMCRKYKPPRSHHCKQCNR